MYLCILLCYIFANSCHGCTAIYKTSVFDIKEKLPWYIFKNISSRPLIELYILPSSTFYCSVPSKTYSVIPCIYIFFWTWFTYGCEPFMYKIVSLHYDICFFCECFNMKYSFILLKLYTDFATGQIASTIKNVWYIMGIVWN